jgi:hypothetical protein
MADKKISALPASTVPLAGTELVPIVQSGVTKKVSVDDFTTGRTVSAVTFVAATSVNVGQGGAGAGTGVVYLNGGSTGGGFIQGLQNGTPTWLIGDTATALGSGTGMIEFIYGGAPKITYLQGTGEIHRTTADGIAMASGKGIDFSADGQAAGMTSELLDDYEEGTWTPLIYGSSGGVFTSTAAIGRYTKVGRVVSVSCRYTYSSIGTVGVNDYAFMSGLPFASANIDLETLGSMQIGQSSFQTRIFQPKMQNNGASILFQYDNGIGALYSGGVYMVANSFPSSGDITISLTYITA